ncbi:hypothetical protein EVAR_59888_1 [Eumeta japonica]|uniref:Uncharacterized protein n=1 Tax=Eumeta variegata TaxID=151549 RepID=A0A4C2AFC4_EUMVA|nr:hypothetical protein EVAR_59888_1 [Eumeta japonica]
MCHQIVQESSVPRCGMKPYCCVCSFGIYMPLDAPDEHPSTVFPIGEKAHGRPGESIPAANICSAMARNNPRSRKMAAWHISRSEPVNWGFLGLNALGHFHFQPQ